MRDTGAPWRDTGVSTVPALRRKGIFILNLASCFLNQTPPGRQSNTSWEGVTRITSSTVVSPLATFWAPLIRSGFIPPFTA